MSEAGGGEPPGFEQLPAQAQSQILALLTLLEQDRAAPTTVADRETAMLVHVADSLAGLAFAETATATTICDLGAGAGFPGLVLRRRCRRPASTCSSRSAASASSWSCLLYTSDAADE